MNKLVNISGFNFDVWSKRVPTRCFVNRDEALLSLCANKSVLHVGAADAPFDYEKGVRGQLLHQKIEKVSSSVCGVDVNESAIESLKSLSIKNILHADICISDPLPGRTFDVVMCCDVIEHVQSPGLLLQACKRYMRDDSLLVVTTINATAIKLGIRALFNREAVHSDHLAYYSFSTLGKLLSSVGLLPVNFAVFAYPTIYRFVGSVFNSLMRFSASTADGILMCAKKNIL